MSSLWQQTDTVQATTVQNQELNEIQRNLEYDLREWKESFLEKQQESLPCLNKIFIIN